MHSMLCFPLPGDLRHCYSSELIRNIIVSEVICITFHFMTYHLVYTAFQIVYGI